MVNNKDKPMGMQENALEEQGRTGARGSAGMSRRSFLGRMGKGGATLAIFGLGAESALQGLFGRSTLSMAIASTLENFVVEGKVEGLKVLNDRPLNAELPAHLLHDEVTPFSKMFIRNNGIPPAKSGIDVAQWTLMVDGEAVSRPKSYTIADLKSNFKHHTLQIWIECGGNGRAGFEPSPRGNQWEVGAIGCPEWTGVRLRDILNDVGYDKDKAVYIGYVGGDTHLSGREDLDVISRGVPMRKALEDETLVAFAMNGEAIPELHGYPLRLIAPGFPGSASGKWLKGILVRDREHDGAKMTGQSYRLPCNPVEPGAEVAKENMCIMEEMPVKSLITYPQSGARTTVANGLKVAGKAWDGFGDVKELHISIDYGRSWQKAKLNRPRNKFAWQSWEVEIQFPKNGFYQVWAVATNSKGDRQPMRVPGWNPRGYGNNQAHHIDVHVDA